MPDIWMDVDVALAEVPVNIMPLIDDTDFKTIEDAVAYNAAGMSLIWHFVTTAGVMTETAVTPTTAGVHDWTDQGTSGLYALEIPASAGTINNDTEGFGWFTGVATGVCPWRGPTIGFRAAALNNALIDGGDNLDINVVQWLGAAVATPTTAGVPEVDNTYTGGILQTGNDNGADINTLLTRIIGTLAAGTHNPASAAQIAVLSDLIDGGRLDLILDIIAADTTTDIPALIATAQADLDIITGDAGALLDSTATSAQLVDDIWDEAIAGHLTAGSAGLYLALAGGVVIDATVTGTPTTTSVDFTGGVNQVDFYEDQLAWIIAGTGVGQARPITNSSYSGGVTTLSFDEAFQIAPVSGDRIVVQVGHTHPISQIQAGLATEAKQDATDIVIAELTTQGDTNETKIDLLPTVAQFEARTPTAAQLAYIVDNAATGKPVTFSGTGTTTTGTMALVDGVTPDATDDQYNGRLLVFNAGTLDEVVTDITDYDGTTKIATVTAVPVAITSAHTARLI